MRLLPKRLRVARFAIYLVASLLVLLAIDLVLVQVRRTIHPGFETTRIVAPTDADGMIDYLKAIEDNFSAGITDENNAAPLLLEAFGRGALPSTQPPDGITDRLHMPHLPAAGNYLVDTATFEASLDPKGQKVDLDIDKWPVSTQAHVIDWVKKNEKPLTKIRSATLRSRYFMPMDGGHRPRMLYEILLPHVNLLPETSYLLGADALLKAEAGDYSTAAADVLAMHRFARLTSQAPTLVERMVSTFNEIRACRVERTIARHCTLDAQTTAEFLASSLSLGELPSLTRNIDVGERYLMLDFEQRTARLGPYETGVIYLQISDMHPPAGRSASTLSQLFRLIPVPHAEAMRAENAAYDALIVALNKPTYAERRAAIQDVQSWYDQRSAGWTSLAGPYWLLRLAMPDIKKSAEGQMEMATAQLRLTQITWALAVYRSEHSHYPDSLDLLKSQFPGGIPEDNFCEQPFHYKPMDAGYQLYSVGPNGADDHGATTKPADDIDASVM